MTDMSKKSFEDLTKAVEEKRKELRTIRFDRAGGAKKNTKASMLTRKEIARTLTELNARKGVSA
ncbi:MAG: 50S ribosomal protein L29 [Minisyncoccota bacterium]